MKTITLCVGIPACGKSTWAKEEVRRDPEGIVRINRDDLRHMMNSYHHSDSNEKMVTEVAENIFLSALKKGRNVILDNTHLNKRYFDEVCKTVRELNIDCTVMEKSFYVDLDEAISRDSQRENKVGEDIIKKFWKKSGGNQHKFYKPRVEVILKKNESEVLSSALVTDATLPWAVISDLDGTVSLFNKVDDDGKVTIVHPGVHARNPYDASRSDQDGLNEQVATVLNSFNEGGYKVLFVSGRKDIYREQTEKFLQKHFSHIKYELFMRKSDDNRKDSLVKEEIYQKFIALNYNVFLILDDRTSVIKSWRKLGLVCWQVAEGDF